MMRLRQQPQRWPKHSDGCWGHRPCAKLQCQARSSPEARQGCFHSKSIFCCMAPVNSDHSNRLLLAFILLLQAVR